jgi:dTDP-4-amino-4,6-dideoxygalactose transaminase
MVVGDENLTHTFWVTPVRVRNRAAVIGALRSAGFDATGLSSLIVVPSGREFPLNEAPAAAWLKELVFLPSGDDMTESEWQRQVAILEQVAEAVETPAARELAELSGVSSTS